MNFGRHAPEERLTGRWRIHFPNGYGASIISDGYGSDRGLYEVGVLRGNDLTYATPIADDVIGYVDADEVGEILDRIESLSESDVAAETVRRAQADVVKALDDLDRAVEALRSLIGGAA